MNQSREYNQFSYPGEEGRETETPDARANGSSEHRESHHRCEPAVPGARGKGAGGSGPASLCAHECVCVRVRAWGWDKDPSWSHSCPLWSSRRDVPLSVPTLSARPGQGQLWGNTVPPVIAETLSIVLDFRIAHHL